MNSTLKNIITVALVVFLLVLLLEFATQRRSRFHRFGWNEYRDEAPVFYCAHFPAPRFAVHFGHSFNHHRR